MSDFDDLRQIREAKERTEAVARQKVLDEQHQQLQTASSLKERKRSFGAELDTTVMSALEALREAVYPEMQTRSRGLAEPTRKWEQDIEPCWAIVGGDSGTDPDYGMEFVTVRLDFDEFGHPTHFVCNRLSVIIEETLPQKSSGMSRLFRQRDKDEPSRKWAKVDFEPVLSDLTSVDLLQALRKLHPPQTVNAPPAYGSR